MREPECLKPHHSRGGLPPLQRTPFNIINVRILLIINHKDSLLEEGRGYMAETEETAIIDERPDERQLTPV